MFVVNFIGDLLLSLIVSLVLIFVGMYFRHHYALNIGSHGIVVPAGQKNRYKWLYAQVIGPKIAIRYGIESVIVTCFVALLMLFFDYRVENIVYMGVAMGFVFLVAYFLTIENLVNNFKPEWVEQQNDKDKEMWLNIVTTLIRNKEYLQLDNFIRDSTNNENSGL